MTERASVQNPMLKYAQQIGWQYINPPEALSQRGDETGLCISDILNSLSSMKLFTYLSRTMALLRVRYNFMLLTIEYIY